MYSGFLEESRDTGSKLNTELNKNIKFPSINILARYKRDFETHKNKTTLLIH